MMDHQDSKGNSSLCTVNVAVGWNDRISGYKEREKSSIKQVTNLKGDFFSLTLNELSAVAE